MNDSTRNETPTSAALAADQEHFEPRGALTFALLMLLGFVLYWFYIWAIVVFERG
ncbi:MAG: hypothetical protein RLZZ387_3739 [Chloroflexota bacterium]|jgi:hypothetical protein